MPQSSDKCVILLEGVLDAIVELPEVEAVIKQWSDLEERCQGPLIQPSLRASYYNEMLDAAKVFDPLLRRMLLRALENGPPPPEYEEWESDGLRFRIRLTEPSPIGKRFELVIPEEMPWGLAEWNLDSFVSEVRAQIQAVEKVESKARAKRPVSDYATALRRDGRWLFSKKTRRANVDAIAAEYHQGQSRQHLKRQDSDKICDNCRRYVKARLANAHKILAASD